MTGTSLALILAVGGPAPACAPAEVLPGPGSADPFRLPAPAAVDLNAAGKTLYREGKWDAARAKYRAAIGADADYLAPRLNVACSFVRQERFGDAVEEVIALVDRAYLPWSREVVEAADLGALKPRAEMKRIEAALAAAARAWGAGLEDDLVFVARVRAPLGLPAEGVLVLGPQQEIFAWSPTTGRYRQLTADDGQVLAIARAPDRRRILYATAEKLVRPAGGAPPALRGVAIRLLDLRQMSRSEATAVPGNVRRLELGWQGAQPALSAVSEAGEATYVLDGGRLVTRRMRLGSPTVLTPAGVAASSPVRSTGPCPMSATERRVRGSPPVVEVKVGGKTVTLPTRHGAGLRGLAL